MSIVAHDLDDDLAALATGADIVVFRSHATDTRTLEQRLRDASVRHAFADMPMGEAVERDRFRRLSAATGRHQLPIVFARGEYLGGEPELVAWLNAQAPAAPRPTLRDVLGYAGLLPFLAGTVWLALAPATQHAPIETLLLAYGAVILSFVGALHWGWALAEPADANADSRFGWSVVPSLLGWFALLPPPGYGLLLLALGFLLARYADHQLYPQQLRLASFLRLRTNLTVVVVVSLLLAAFTRG